ncbi:MAG: type II CRISPR-associated endonuclease Cas1 [Oscillospiraceae bacterium]|jgi:CRISPR-associated protein Cas1|nr:type II CRISPR-associated endonuclease Cas1 [Oscillospiraceae bacterium]
MGFRNVMIMGDVALSLKNCCLCVKGESVVSIPVEDIDTVLIENRQSTISTALLSALAQAGAALFVCDEKHMPSAVLQPFHRHSRQSEVMHAQLAATRPTQKQLWQQIVIAKIENQAKCLALQSLAAEAAHLRSVAKSVRSGDEGNAEAVAAAYYFPRLFEKGFTRGKEEDARNAALNYGYSILRGCIARSLALYGFLPAFGLHHRSGLNQFNLADDVIEPFRPLVDLFVVRTVETPDEEFTPALRRQLFNLINYEIEVNRKTYGVSYAIELTVQSLSAALVQGAKEIQLPALQELCQHSYE